MAKRILVTGGAGFLGSHLCDRLIQSGAEVICLDNFFTGNRKNIAHLLRIRTLSCFGTMSLNLILLEADQIYNLACPASPVHYQYNPIKTVKTNFLGTMNMLGLATRVRARIFQASTSEVYGDPLVTSSNRSLLGTRESDRASQLLRRGKRVAETLMMDYHRENGCDIRIVRIFNTYGPSMALNDGRVVSNFIVQALRERADHDLRQWITNALVLLCFGLDRGDLVG